MYANSSTSSCASETSTAAADAVAFDEAYSSTFLALAVAVTFIASAAWAASSAASASDFSYAAAGNSEQPSAEGFAAHVATRSSAAATNTS